MIYYLRKHQDKAKEFLMSFAETEGKGIVDRHCPAP
jgi:hypothetical protein